jgi:CheY-like chemotaxis protein
MTQVEQRLRVLVIDDEKNIRTMLEVCLEQAGCDVTQTASGVSALGALGHHPFDVAFLDLRLGEERGQDLIPRLLALSPDLPIVAMTAGATIETAVETLQRGAWDFLQKPFTPDRVRHFLGRLRERRPTPRRLRRQTIDPVLEARKPEDYPRPVKGTAAAVLFGLAMVAIGLSLAGKGDRDELWRLPAVERAGYFARTLSDVSMGCAGAEVPTAIVREHCQHQARFLLLFPECDSACRQLAIGALPRSR